jgi:TolB protein
MHGRHKIAQTMMVVVAVLCWITGCRQAVPTMTPAPVEAPQSPVPATIGPTVRPWRTYSSPLIGVSFEYPGDWQKASGDVERYEGSTGFFQLDLMAWEGWTIDDVAGYVGREKIMPYILPVPIERLQVQGQEARLIKYGGDAMRYAQGQAWVLVELPQPVRTEGQGYRFLLVWADDEHIMDIAGSLRFGEAGTTESTQ